MLVGTITDDQRLFEVPKLRVVALKFTETARARILKVCPCIAVFAPIPSISGSFTRQNHPCPGLAWMHACLCPHVFVSG